MEQVKGAMEAVLAEAEREVAGGAVVEMAKEAVAVAATEAETQEVGTTAVASVE